MGASAVGGFETACSPGCTDKSWPACLSDPSEPTKPPTPTAASLSMGGRVGEYSGPNLHNGKPSAESTCPWRAVGTIAFLNGENIKVNLPTELSPASRTILQETAPAVIDNADVIASNFYSFLFQSNPEFKSTFNRSNQELGRQKQAFASAVNTFASSIDDPHVLRPVIDLIACKHCSLGVEPRHYVVTQHVVSAAIDEALRPTVGCAAAAAWSEALLFFSSMLVRREEELCNEARARNGGWRGFRRFYVSKRRLETPTVMVFTLKPVDTNGVYFDFVPGQYVSIKVDPDADNSLAPRQYTITSQPGLPFIEVSVKKIPGGEVSTFLHEKCKEGRPLLVSPPFGVFTPARSMQSFIDLPHPGHNGLRQSHGYPRRTIVLISAGIGITPMYSFSKAFLERIAFACHVDKDEASHPFRKHFMERFPHYEVHYTAKEGRPPRAFFSRLPLAYGVHHEWYLCGPGPFMFQAMRALVDGGVEPALIHFELFGPQLGTANDVRQATDILPQEEIDCVLDFDESNKVFASPLEGPMI
eukprot:TRINITY_DN55144_c0_g1_i1.p1 TRINITY_DN55144_c0_g1~~TRINITY_DN55144_c0_g1_i1.p1  ORF type:complete len:530 (-),score=76.18 TRINITY_DN55144_c0_g1_i1:53-1642(-)